jgi:hypothetical protein
MHPWPFLLRVGGRSNGRADLRQNETIAVDPAGILWIESHELVEEHMGDGGEAHGGPGMAGIGFEGGIRLGQLVGTW